MSLPISNEDDAPGSNSLIQAARTETPSLSTTFFPIAGIPMPGSALFARTCAKDRPRLPGVITATPSIPRSSLTEPLIRFCAASGVVDRASKLARTPPGR